MGLADLHLHTNFSDGLDSPRDVVHAAHRGNIDLIAVTDHDTIEGALRARSYASTRGDLGVEVVVGEEISSLNGHIIGLFLDEFIPPRLTARRTVELIHAQGGLAVLAHPYHAYTGRFRGFPKACDLLPGIPFDAVETVNRDNALSVWSQPAAERLARRHGLATLGVSDAHQARLIGMGFTEYEGRGGEALRRSIEARTCRARSGRPWKADDIWRYLKDSTRVLWRYSRLRATA